MFSFKIAVPSSQENKKDSICIMGKTLRGQQWYEEALKLMQFTRDSVKIECDPHEGVYFCQATL